MAAVTAPTAPKLAEGQHVIVRHVSLGMLPGTIDKLTGGDVTVALNVKDERVARVLGHDMAVEITHARGIYRFGGKLSTHREGTLTITLNGDVERIQRREFVRVPAFLEVTVRGVDEDVGGDTTTLDVSGAGIQINDPWNLPLGIDVRVELKLPGEGPPLKALGRVVRVGAEEDQKGIRLDDLARTEEDRLMRYIREREVQALRAARNA
jgi:c-di-GMP-binding flagellar brake protein YcgR